MVRILEVACSELVAFLVFALGSLASAQSIGAGTITGTVVDPSGAAIPGATVTIQNPVTSYKQTASTDAAGAFRFNNVPWNAYHVEAAAAGFQTGAQDIAVRTAVPMSLTLKLVIAGANTTIEVESAGADVLENVSYAHNDVDANALARLPVSSPGSGLSDAIALNTPGVVADSNGFFHPLGDHAQTSYVVDGQPINDQQSKAFSTQLPENAFQSLELITGMAPAQYGDKTSLVVDAVTRSGLGKKPFGQFDLSYGSFGTIGEHGSVGWGSAKFGNFLVANGARSGRFLDTPEFWPAHDTGNNITLFDRIDYHPSDVDSFHLNLFTSRNWFQVPNNYDNPEQDQRQKVVSFNIAPGLSAHLRRVEAPRPSTRGSAAMWSTTTPAATRSSTSPPPSRSIAHCSTGERAATSPSSPAGTTSSSGPRSSRPASTSSSPSESPTPRSTSPKPRASHPTT